jgi:L1 cell adhesion molecule like protein
MTKDNNSLGTFELLGIPPMKKGQPRIKVKFMVDVNGIMSVEATEESTNKHNKILIENKKGRLDETIIEKMIKDSERFSEKDKMVKDRIEAKNNLECYISSSKNSLDNTELKVKLGEEKFIEIYKKIQLIQDWLDQTEDATGINKEDYDNKYKELEDYLIPIFKDILN